MRGPNGVVVATAGAGAFASTPQCTHRQAKRRWRMTYGLTGGFSISSYSPINSLSTSDEKEPPHRSQALGMWSRNSSGLSASRRLCGSCPGFAPPGREFSRFSFLSVEGGLDDVREFLSGRWSRSTNSINCSLLSCCKSVRSMSPMDSEIAPHGKGVGNYVGWLEETGASLQDGEKAGDGALGEFSQRAFQLGDRHLDGVEVRAVGRQVSDRAVFPGQDFRHCRAFVSLEIVEQDDVALLQSRQEMVLEPGFEGLGVHGVVVGLGCDDASQAQAEDEGDRFVMPIRNAAAQTLAAPAPAVAARHVGGCRRLIDEHQFQRIEVELTVEPSPPPLKDIRAVLL